MKKIFFVSFSLMLNHSVFADVNSSVEAWPLPTPSEEAAEILRQMSPPPHPRAQPPKPIFAEDDPILQAFSPKALELIRSYRPWANSPMNHVITVTYPPHNKEKHYNEEYRPAWEELYREVALDGVYAKRFNFINVSTNGLRDASGHAKHDGNKGLTAALSEIASANSIPMLVDVYTQLLENNKDEKQERQKEMLGILLQINAPEALDAVFSLLDLAENKVGAEPVATLRASLVNELQQALQKQENLKTYQNPNLSANNKALLEMARRNENQP